MFLTLNGMMDEFLNEGFYPLFETNRGCPFSCTFCVGNFCITQNKTFSMERIIAEFDYVAENSIKSKYCF